MNPLLKQMLMVCVCLFALTGQAIADSLSDALNAYEAGNYAKAAELIRSLAEQGDASAQNRLGAMYSDGKGVPQDHKEAAKWLRLAAEQGNANAQNNLGLMYFLGEGVPQDYKEALKWQLLAAGQGNIAAQYAIGVMHHIGQGVPQDYKEAVKCYLLAAEQGNVNAQTNLGGMYENGEGVLQDFVLAHMWINIAAASSPDAKFQQKAASRRNSVAKKMTAQQIVEAQELARKCIANKLKGC